MKDNKNKATFSFYMVLQVPVHCPALVHLFNLIKVSTYYWVCRMQVNTKTCMEGSNNRSKWGGGHS